MATSGRLSYIGHASVFTGLGDSQGQELNEIVQYINTPVCSLVSQSVLYLWGYNFEGRPGGPQGYFAQ